MLKYFPSLTTSQEKIPLREKGIKEALKVREFPECKGKFDHDIKWPQGLETEKKFNSRNLYHKIVYKKDRKRPRWVLEGLLYFGIYNPLKCFSFENVSGFDFKKWSYRQD